MSSISNRFFVSTLDDGTTLHGNLSSDKPLSQAWTGSSAVPRWDIDADGDGKIDGPTIFLTLLSGNLFVAPQQNYTWYYEGSAIEFNPSTGISSDGLFKKTTYNVPTGQQNPSYIEMPAIQIIGNLAAQNNVNVDMITFSGSCNIGGSSLPFDCAAQIRITEIQGNGFLGQINFVGGIKDITKAGQVITMYGTLYDTNGGNVACTTKYYINESSTPHAGANITIDNVTYPNAFQVEESNNSATGVVDHAVIKCEFYSGNQLRYTAYEGIDDVQDPQYMYIQYNGNNGNAAALRKTDDHVTFSIWVGLRDDASVLGGANNPTFKKIKVRLLDGNGNEITDAGLPGINDRDETGYRPLSMSGGKGTISIYYDTVNEKGKNLTGIVIAYTS